jgi:hypothetical protein
MHEPSEHIFLADTALYAHLVSKLGDLLSVSLSDKIVADLFDRLLKGDDVVNDICENSNYHCS